MMDRKQITWSIVTKALPFVVSSATTLGLVRVLPVMAYATYSLAIAVLTISASMLDAGVSTATARLLAQQRYSLRLVLRATALMWLCATAIGSLLILLTIGPIASLLHSSELAGLGVIVAVLFALRVGHVRLQRVAAGLQRNETVGKASALYSWVSPSLAVVFPLVYEPSASAALMGVAIGRAIVLGASLRGLVVALNSEDSGLLESRRHGESILSVRQRVVIRRLTRYAAPQAGIGMSLSLYNNAGVLLVQRLLGATDAAHYALAIRLIEMLAVPGSGFAAAVGPHFARTLDNTWELARRYAWQILTFYVPSLIVLAFLTPWVLPALVGPAFSPAAMIVLWFFPFLLCQVVATLFGAALDYIGTTMRRVAVVMATTLLYIVTALLVFPHVGVRGAALVTAITYAPMVGVYAYLIAKHRAPGSVALYSNREQHAVPSPQ